MALLEPPLPEQFMPGLLKLELARLTPAIFSDLAPLAFPL